MPAICLASNPASSSIYGTSHLANQRQDAHISDQVHAVLRAVPGRRWFRIHAYHRWHPVCRSKVRRHVQVRLDCAERTMACGYVEKQFTWMQLIRLRTRSGLYDVSTMYTHCCVYAHILLQVIHAQAALKTVRRSCQSNLLVQRLMQNLALVMDGSSRKRRKIAVTTKAQ